MRLLLATTLLLIGALTAAAQAPTLYEISFENAVHHQAQVKVTFPNLPLEVLEVRMSRSSPGRYAIHEFAKNVFNVKAFDGKGKQLVVTRPDPYQWNVSGHDGTVVFTYTIFGDRGDGTYMQVDESHAHLNMPATFVFARGLDYRPARVHYQVPAGSNWKVATQLKPIDDFTFFAPNLQYLMDSPAEISNFKLHAFDVESSGKTYSIRVALHHDATPEAIAQYVDGVKKIVAQEKAVFGELPNYDYGTYTFLACYSPRSSGDGMEHRNSTFVTGPLNARPLTGALSTVSHEFFHCWNVERIRPAALEPFDFEEANMSGELWFAEGFTNYYTSLILCRSGLLSRKEYVEGLARTINYVSNSPARAYFNPIEMSYQAPFADAATSIDPNYRSNTFISYYVYGEVLGLALDLQLRNEKGDLSLDGFMKFVWGRHGKPELPYNVRDLRAALADYASPAFADSFFDKHIFQSQMPDYEKLLASVGVSYASVGNTSWLGASMELRDSLIVISNYTTIGSPAYKAGLEQGDQIMSVNGQKYNDPKALLAAVSQMVPNTKANVEFMRQGVRRTAALTTERDPSKRTLLFEDDGKTADNGVAKRRSAWLDQK
ncbi:PDZ domain-containing protein [Chryseolinea sp. T2]|uniref:M61 family metallopeptidase n=1 Tax=Chryseolinea sp. T2 TaxID=3129255 RepID=UPI003077EB8D